MHLTFLSMSTFWKFVAVQGSWPPKSQPGHWNRAFALTSCTSPARTGLLRASGRVALAALGPCIMVSHPARPFSLSLVFLSVASPLSILTRSFLFGLCASFNKFDAVVRLSALLVEQLLLPAQLL